jgi:hypothetical protein
MKVADNGRVVNVLLSEVREFTDANGKVVRIRVDIESGARFDKEVLRVAGKARWTKQGFATSAGGVLRVTVLSDPAMEEWMKNGWKEKEVK